MENLFWKDGDYDAVGGFFVRNNLFQFISKLKQNGLNPVGIKVNDDWNLEVIVEKNDAYNDIYERQKNG